MQDDDIMQDPEYLNAVDYFSLHFIETGDEFILVYPPLFPIPMRAKTLDDLFEQFIAVYESYHEVKFKIPTV